MPSTEEVRRAFALFDANGDGMLSLDELKAILCRPTPLQPPLSEAKVEQIMRELDTNGDDQLSMDELAAGWATLSIGSLLVSATRRRRPASPRSSTPARWSCPTSTTGRTRSALTTPTSSARFEGTRGQGYKRSAPRVA